MAIQIRNVCPLLQVFDMPTSIRFYRDVLGFAVAQTSRPDEGFTWALLRRDGAEIMLNTAYEDGERCDASQHWSCEVEPAAAAFLAGLSITS